MESVRIREDRYNPVFDEIFDFYLAKGYSGDFNLTSKLFLERTSLNFEVIIRCVDMKYTSNYFYFSPTFSQNYISSFIDRFNYFLKSIMEQIENILGMITNKG